jgi:AcrR family transcriptional regulator
MPRGRAPGYDTQREQILARAAELFARQGFTATSMNQVAHACGVSKPSLYHYVRDKYQLLVEIAEDHVGRLNALVAVARSKPLEPQERVRELIGSFLEVYASAQAAHRVLTEDVKFLEPEDRERVLGAQRRVVASFADAIAEARPALRAAELQKPVAMLLFGMMNWMFTWLQPSGRLTHADLAPVVADLFFGGLAAVRLDAPPARARPTRQEAAAKKPDPHDARTRVAAGALQPSTTANPKRKPP